MKIKKLIKIIVLGCSLLLALSLTACGRDSNMKDDIKDGMSAIESTADNLMNGGKTSSTDAKITENDAKAAAFKDAGVNESDATGVRVDLDRDDGILKYEVDFYVGGTEYDYEINAETGEIISSDKDMD